MFMEPSYNVGEIGYGIAMTGEDAPRMEAERSLALVAYVLHLTGAITGLTSIIGLVLNYVWKRHRIGPFESHHRWMIRSFWWALLGIVIGSILTFVLIGWLILGLAWLWYVYRHIRGLVNLVGGASMPG